MNRYPAKIAQDKPDTRPRYPDTPNRAIAPPKARQPSPPNKWRDAAPQTAPEKYQCAAMLKELESQFGVNQVLIALGIRVGDYLHWRSGRISLTVRRGVWATYVFLLHPELCQSAFDFWTWGRFRRVLPVDPSRLPKSRKKRAPQARAARPLVPPA